MSILDKIAELLQDSRKIGDTVSRDLLSTLYSECAMVGKNSNPAREVTDAETITVIRRFLKGVDECSMVAVDRGDIAATCKLRIEEELLLSFLPFQFSEIELCTKIHFVIKDLNIQKGDLSGIGKVLKVLKSKYDGSYDGQVASKLTKELILNG